MAARFGDARVDVASFGSGREEFRELFYNAGQLFPFSVPIGPARNGPSSLMGSQSFGACKGLLRQWQVLRV